MRIVIAVGLIASSMACGSGRSDRVATAALPQALEGGPDESNSRCRQRAENVRAQFLSAWETADDRVGPQSVTLPLSSCNVVMGASVCGCLSDTSCTTIVRPAQPCYCDDPGRGAGLPYQWPNSWSQVDPCGTPAGTTLDGISHQLIRDAAWGHSQTWDYKPAERFVFTYKNGTVNEAYTENPASFHTVLCGDGRAYVETWLQWVNPDYENTATCSTLDRQP